MDRLISCSFAHAPRLATARSGSQRGGCGEERHGALTAPRGLDARRGELQRQPLDRRAVDLEELVEVVRLDGRGGRAVELDACEARGPEQLEHRAEVPRVEPDVQVPDLADYARGREAAVDVAAVDVQVVDALEELEHGFDEVDVQELEAQAPQWVPRPRRREDRAGREHPEWPHEDEGLKPRQKEDRVV